MKATLKRSKRLTVELQDSRILKSSKPLEQKTTVNDEYTYVQSSASDTWIINHNLNRKPSSVSVLSAGGMEVEASITHVSDNQLIVNFNLPFIGSVRIS